MASASKETGFKTNSAVAAAMRPFLKGNNEILEKHAQPPKVTSVDNSATRIIPGASAVCDESANLFARVRDDERTLSKLRLDRNFRPCPVDPLRLQFKDHSFNFVVPTTQY